MTLAAVALGFSSCSEDRDPVYHAPTEFVLNQPAMQDQLIELTEGNTLELVTSQPDYGYSAVANYSAQMSLTEDFADFRELSSTDGTQARMYVKQEDVAQYLCELHGVDSEESFAAMYPNGMQPEKVYFRAVCELDGVEGSQILSNVVSYNQLKGYFAVAVPGYIYLVGAPEGWAGPTEANAAHYADWRLFEPDNAIGSKVYSGVFDIPAGSAMFRFYTALTGWDADSWGSQVDDNPIEYASFTGAESGDTFTNAVVAGKGAFSFPNWVGGKMTIVVDMSDSKNVSMTITAGEADVVVSTYVYMVGNNGGWAEPVEGTYADWKLADSTGSGVYTGTFDMTGFTADNGVLYCRFYQELTGWGAAQWSADASGGNVECSFGTTYPTYAGEGCFQVAGVADKQLTVTLDTNNNTVVFTAE